MRTYTLGSGGRSRKALIAAGGITAVAGGLLLAPSVAHAAPGCKVVYSANSWPGGFTANINVTNLGDALTSWKLEFDYAGDQKVTQAWNATSSQSGKHVTLSNASWNGSLGSNATANPGFQGTYSGTNADPTSFTLNGTACTGTPVTTTPSPSSSTPSPSTSSPSPTTSSPSPTTSSPSPTTSSPSPTGNPGQ